MHARRECASQRRWIFFATNRSCRRRRSTATSPSRVTLGSVVTEMQTVLWIAGVGVTLLLAAFGCLIGLIYLMTSPIFQRAVVVAQSAPADAVLDNLEQDRRRRAAAVAVAIARAEATELPPAVDTPA